MTCLDPYCKWLAIPPEEQPPSHYRLFGSNELEHDQDVIAAAAHRQMTYIKSLSTGAQAEVAQRLLTEFLEARLFTEHRA